MNIELLDPATSDLEELAALQRDAFKGVTGTSALDTVIGSLQSAAHLRRKYHAPAGRAKIVAIREQGNLLAMNAMVPVTLRHAVGTARGWQSCDTATHPNARGRGLFMLCLKTLREQLDDGDVFFGYPNANSRSGFSKHGWSTRAVLDAYAAYVPGFPGEQRIHRITHFDSRHDAFAERLARPGTVCIDRSAAYLNWRYFSNPSGPYAAFICGLGNEIEGYAVVRSLPAGFRRACIILESFGSTPKVESALFRAAIRWGLQNGAWPTLMFSNCWGEDAWFRQGFVRLPRRISPRQLNLMGSGIGNEGRRIFDLEWRAFVGDWDVF